MSIPLHIHFHIRATSYALPSKLALVSNSPAPCVHRHRISSCRTESIFRGDFHHIELIQLQSRICWDSDRGENNGIQIDIGIALIYLCVIVISNVSIKERGINSVSPSEMFHSGVEGQHIGHSEPAILVALIDSRFD